MSKRRPLPEVDLVTVWEALGGELVGPDAGLWRKAKCPLHMDGTASAVVNEDEGAWRCFTCSIGGDVFTLIMEAKGVEFKEAIEIARTFDGRAPRPQRQSSLITRPGRRQGNWTPPWLRR